MNASFMSKANAEHVCCHKGPTSYGPVIDAAIDIVEKSGGQLHVLVIIADGQVKSHACFFSFSLIYVLSFFFSFFLANVYPNLISFCVKYEGHTKC